MSGLLCCLYVFTELALYVPHDNPTPWDRPTATNPYASIGIGWEKELSRGAFYVQLKHTSGVRIGDQGDDALLAGGRLYFGERL